MKPHTGPGFVDLQVNGYGGIDFSAPGLTLEAVHEVSQSLLTAGTVAYCPTLITASEEVYRENLRVIAEAMRDSERGQCLLGIHLEGPCFALASAGAHPREHIRDPDVDAFLKWNEWAEGNIVLHTVAPELPGGLDYIRRLCAEGVQVSLGHHMAGREVIQAAIDAGATLCTHLGNGIPNELHRYNNPILDQLANDGLAAMFIPDGHHIPETLIQCITRMKKVEQCIAVSDSAPIAGLDPGAYPLWGMDVILDETGLLQRADGTCLAGSAYTLMQCMNVLADMGSFDESALWDMGLHNPLKHLGRSLPEALHLPRVVFEQNTFRMMACGSCPTKTP
ncbi:N-acetylglucosamine-6-phosphate deacetylase [Kiritimatiellaeota bacterium B1221]|nr:N-acetylglucosamine-6-phosphate deacetylase [Kiritimatiellaeota bacterium B1221]